MAEKINPKDYGFKSDDWEKVNNQVREWIVLNKELWNNLTKYEQNALKTSKDMAKNAKESSENVKEIRNLAEEHNKIIKKSLGMSKNLLTIRANLSKLAINAIKYDQQSDALSKKRLKVISRTVDITGDYLANMDAIGEDEFQSLDINKLIRDAIRAKLPDEEAYLRTLKAEHDIQKRLNGEINAQSDLIKKPFEYVDGLIQRLPIMGDMLSKKFDLTGKGQDMADAFVEKAQKAAMAQKELESGPEKGGGGLDMRFKKNKEFVKSQKKGNALLKKAGPYALAAAAAIGAMAVSAFNFARDMGVGLSQITPTMLLFKDETKALLDEFGGIDDVSTGMLFTMKKASFFSGVQASDMAKIAMLQTSITGDTKEMALDKQAKFITQIKKEGLSAAKVMGDLASNADMFAMYAKDGGKNMEEAAKQAAKMGLDLSATSSVAEKLLDWESSIAAEMEASQILGRSINFDKARQLAYSGDLKEMMTEVKNQAGGEAEFAKMSVVQRQALGDAIGLSGANLAEFMKTESEANEQSKRGWMLKFGIIVGALTAVGALIGFILGALAPWKLAGAGIGAAWGAGIGLGMGALAAGAIAKFGTAGDVFSPADGKTQVSTKEGGLYNLSKNDDVIAAPGLVNNMENSLKGKTQISTKEGGIYNLSKAEGTMQYGDMSETNSKLDKLVGLYNLSKPGLVNNAENSPVVNIDNSKMETKLDQVIGLLSKQPTAEQTTDQTRKLGRNIEGAFAQR